MRDSAQRLFCRPWYRSKDRRKADAPLCLVAWWKISMTGTPVGVLTTASRSRIQKHIVSAVTNIVANPIATVLTRIKVDFDGRLYLWSALALNGVNGGYFAYTPDFFGHTNTTVKPIQRSAVFWKPKEKLPCPSWPPNENAGFVNPTMKAIPLDFQLVLFTNVEDERSRVLGKRSPKDGHIHDEKGHNAKD